MRIARPPYPSEFGKYMATGAVVPLGEGVGSEVRPVNPSDPPLGRAGESR